MKREESCAVCFMSRKEDELKIRSDLFFLSIIQDRIFKIEFRIYLSIKQEKN